MGKVELVILLVLSLSQHHVYARIVYEKQVEVSCKVSIQAGEDLCALLGKSIARWKREGGPCSNITLSSLQTEVMKDLLSHPDTLSIIAMKENAFVSCKLPSDKVCTVHSSSTFWKIDQDRFLGNLLDILSNDTVPEKVMQQIFLYLYEESLIKLTSLEYIKLFSMAYALRPNSSLIVNRFGMSLELIGRHDLKDVLYDYTVERGIWPSKLQRPEIDYISGLESQPWYNSSDFAFVKVLEENYITFKEELVNLNRSMFGIEGENFNSFSGGDWKALVLISSEGYSSASSYLPQTTEVLKSTGENFLLVKYSALKPGTHILPHTGPSNNRLRAHFCITHTGGAWMRVGSEWRTWHEGKVNILDSSFEHEVIHNGSDERIVLILDIWHPDYLP